MAPHAAPGAQSAYVISITPFTQGGELDEAGLRAHLTRLAASGIGIYLGGSGSGEGYTLSAADMQRVLEIGVETVGGSVPVWYMGTEPRTAAEMCRDLAAAAAVGVDGAQIYSLDVGHGHLPRPDAVERYLRTALESTDLPCVVSSHQSVGYRVEADLYAQLLADYPHLTGVNCSHSDQRYLRELIGISVGRATVHVGGEAAALPALAFGATGFLSSAANMAPQLAMSVIDRFTANDLTGWTDAWSRLHALGDLLYGNGGILATKAALNRFGLAGGYPRLPHLPLPDDVVDRVVAKVVDLAIPSIEGWPTE